MSSARRTRRRASRSAAWLRTRPCAHGQALIPVASTPTTRRVPDSDAAAIPQQRHHLLRREVRDRRASADRPLRADPHLGAERALALDDAARDVLGEHLDEERLPVDDDRRSPPRRAPGSATCARPSGRRRGRRCSRSPPPSTVSASPRRMRIAFWTPVTPARERASPISGAEAWRSSDELHAVRHAATVACIRATDACPDRASAAAARAGDPSSSAPARLAARAVVDRVLLEVDAGDRRPALRARLAEAVVDAVDVVVALALLAELEGARRDPRAIAAASRSTSSVESSVEA